MSEQVFSADPISETLQTTRWFRELRARKQASDLSIFRFILSKLLFTEEEMTEEDTVQLFLSYEKVVEKCARDPVFKEKNFLNIFPLRNIFKNLENFAADPLARSEYRKQMESLYSHGRSWLNARIYFGGKKNYSIRMQSSEPRKPKAKNRIAAGYRDKGNAKNTAWDGSPRWQEVATDEWYQLHHSSESSGIKIEQMFQGLTVGEHYSWQGRKALQRKQSFARMMKG